MMWLVVLIVCILLASIAIKWYSAGGQPSPPGPMWVPVVGSFPYLHPKRPYETMEQWAKEYGPVYRMYFGPKPWYVLSTNAVLKEALIEQGDNFAARPQSPLFNTLIGDLHGENRAGIVNTDGEKWKVQRRFGMNVLREFGMGRSAILPVKIGIEIDKMIAKIDQLVTIDAIIDVNTWISYTIGNIAYSLAFGHGFLFDDPNFLSTQKAMRKVGHLLSKPRVLLIDVFPWVQHLPYVSTDFRELKKAVDHIYKLIDQEVAIMLEQMSKHKTVPNDGTSIIKIFIEEREKQKGKAFSKYFSMEEISHVVVNVFFAAVDTSATTLAWTLLHLIHNPEIQEKARREILENIGTDRKPDWTDREKLPYNQAVIAESQRIGNIAPLSVNHSTFKDSVVGGYFIPKGSTIVPNLWAIMRDPDCFPKPHKFIPERFLENGKLRSNVEGFYPFSMGKRVCMGESMAKMELFMLLTALLQRYRFSKIPNTAYNMEYDAGLVVAPMPYKVVVKLVE